MVKINKSAASVVLFLTVFLGGCKNTATVKTVHKNTVKVAGFSASGDKMDEVEKMERCRRELESLKRIDATAYNKLKAEFDKLMYGASLYNGIRNDVGNYTQNAVDALYRFRADKLCADISSGVLNGLSR
ncbi:hypothetical protein [Escherichia coli]|uniref:hypothetical protein n=1 Tax=Escherichia coli TaxID=562 RepID=UPI00130221C2|nr:hypothetical protein [Escherichia coli]KAE9666520.1 hypothetical protein GP722_21330 [Escherichia coli]